MMVKVSKITGGQLLTYKNMSHIRVSLSEIYRMQKFVESWSGGCADYDYETLQGYRATVQPVTSYPHTRNSSERL